MGQLAELFIDITLRGGGKVQLQSLRDQIDAADKSLANNATLYKLHTQGKLDNMGELAEKQEKLAALDVKTYKSKEYADMAAKRAQTDRVRLQATEAKNFADLTAKYGKFGATVLQAREKFAAMLPWPLNQIAGSASAPAAAAAAFMAAIHFAKTTSPEAAGTFDKSMQLVEMSIGRIFIPMLVQASGALQGLSKTIDAISKAKVGGVNVAGAITQATIDASPVGPIMRFFNWINDLTGGTEISLPNARGHFGGSMDAVWRETMMGSAEGGPLERRIAQEQLLALQELVGLARNAPQPGNR